MADNKSTRKRKVDADIRQASMLDKVATRLLAQVDDDYDARQKLNTQDAEIQRVIEKQLDPIQGVSGTQVVDMLASYKDTQNRRLAAAGVSTPKSVDASELFTENVGDIFSYFQDIYKNRYLELNDIKFISKFIPVVGRSVQIYIDSIVSSDDVSQTITRNIELSASVAPEERTSIMNFIERMEKELKLLKKLKIAYTKSLVSGVFYVYHISYQELFETYSRGLANDASRTTVPGKSMFQNGQLGTEPTSGGKSTAPFTNAKIKHGSAKTDNVLNLAATESILVTDIAAEPGLESFGAETAFMAQQGIIRKCSFDKALESTFTEIEHMVPTDSASALEDTSKITGKTLVESIKNDLPNVYFLDTGIPFDIVNDVSGIAEEGFTEFFNETEGVNLMNKKLEKEQQEDVTPDGTYDAGRIKSGEKFSNVTGTYLKWIDYKYIIPIEVLGRKVGYYHILTTAKARKRKGGGGAGEIGSILSNGSMALFGQLDVSERRKEEAIQGIIDTISNAILSQFSAKFVKKNAGLRDVIADCIIANGIIDNDYMIQFIPADHIIEFKCEEDEDGHGTSILANTTFPAHMLLSMVSTKMLNYINKGGNKTIAHISSGRVNRNLSGQVNRVIRDLQSANVTFTDLLSSSAVFSKVTRDSNIAMPKDSQGNRLVEFEVQEGQQIELNTDYETMLERWCAMSAGMPPTVLDYESNVEVAKKVVSDNIQLAGHVASLQSDFEDPTTELYQVLIDNSDMEPSLKAKAKVQFKLPRPRILVNQNNSEALGTAYANAQVVSNVMIGEDANEPEDTLRKRKLTEKVVQKETPFINWEDMREMLKTVDMEIEKESIKKKVDTATAGSSGDAGGDLGSTDYTGSSDFSTNQESGMDEGGKDAGGVNFEGLDM